MEDSTPDSATDSAPAPLAGAAGDSSAAAKASLRTRIRAGRTELMGGAERAQRDASLLRYLLQELDRRDPGRTAGVAAYCPLPGEPGGPDLPDQILSTGRPLWVPVVDSPGSPLRWLPWRGTAHARPAAFGILEPMAATGNVPVDTAPLLKQVKTLVIPALAIGPQGHRLGQGGGFYDRTLADSAADSENRGKLLAIVDHDEFGIPVPVTELDITVPVVVTDAGVVHPEACEPS